MNQTEYPDITRDSRGQAYRHSLQPKSGTETPPSNFRHTQSQNYGNTKTKKAKRKAPPVILEGESPDDEGATSGSVYASNENVTVTIAHVDERKNKQRHSKGSRKSSHSSGSRAYDNAAFETEKNVGLSRSNSAANSIRSSARDPSVQSLTVVREQYCWCNTRSPCERILFATVGVLVFIIIILVIVIALVAKQKENSDSKSLFDGIL